MRTTHRPLIFATAASVLLSLMACEPRTAEDCASDVDAMRDVIVEAVDAAGYCEEDADCAMFDPSNACEDRCAVAVNVYEVDFMSQRILDGELNHCVAYGDDCGFTSVTCEARVPQCNSNRCEMVAE